MIRVKTFNNLDALEKFLSDLDLSVLGDSGSLHEKLIHLDCGPDSDEGWFAILVYRG